MDTSDILHNPDAPLYLKQGILEILERNRIGYPIQVLVPTASNDDINGSQHASGGGTDFTYRDATESDLPDATSLGHYEYFSSYGGDYTGHYYQGSDSKFAAIVIDPPTYAIDLQL